MSAEEKLEAFEDEKGILWCIDQHEPAKSYRDLWEEAPCFLQVATGIPQGGAKLRFLIASKEKLEQETINEWLRLRKEALDEEMGT